MVQRLGVMLVNFRLDFKLAARYRFAGPSQWCSGCRCIKNWLSTIVLKTQRSSGRVWSMDLQDGEIEKISNPSWIRF